MKKPLLLFLVLAGLSLRPATAQTAARVAPARATFTNPLPVQFGDPYVLYAGDTNYMYGTGGRAKKRIADYSSKDLVHWKSEGQV